MPYIKKEDRPKFEAALKLIPKMLKKGELEYCIFWLMKEYLQGKDICYSTLHDTTYAAQHCADEFRRRYLDEREDKAMAENGDV